MAFSVVAVSSRVSPLFTRAGGNRHVDHVGAEAFSRELEAGAGAGAVLKKQVDQGSPAQQVALGLTGAVQQRVALRQVEEVADFGGIHALDGEQMFLGVHKRDVAGRRAKGQGSGRASLARSTIPKYYFLLQKCKDFGDAHHLKGAGDDTSRNPRQGRVFAGYRCDVRDGWRLRTSSTNPRTQQGPEGRSDHRAATRQRRREVVDRRNHGDDPRRGLSLVLVDSNVLLDVITKDAAWYEWSVRALGNALAGSGAVLNPIIYAEISVHYARIEELDLVAPASVFRREPIPYGAAFLAGKAFALYRRRGGTKRSPLPDFFIGAHAAIAGHKLLTRDARRYATYFPSVVLIAPD